MGFNNPRLPWSSTPYAELHCHSNFSFLDGASHPEELVEEGSRLGLEALALTDHDGMYGVVRFAQAASAVGLPTVFGAELSLGLTKPQNGRADPEGRHLLVLARDPVGYGRLCRSISAAQLAGKEKGKPEFGFPPTNAEARAGKRDEPVFSLSALAEAAGGHWLVLTGCRKGTVPAALTAEGPAAAARQLADLVVAFGRDNVAVELWDHGDPLDSARNDALVEVALRQGVEV
ncbi:MAG: PHP domain-containing protein, partial [Actinobacteria bacterium]|nr:PHP domain-containing protein [Actinomycetota bacterium]